jgi:hypothetical protein
MPSFMKEVRQYSGRGDPHEWLDRYYSAAKSEGWKSPQLLDGIYLKLKKQAKRWYRNNFAHSKKPETWDAFVALFLEEFSTGDLQDAIAHCYSVKQKKTESLKKIF